MQSVRQEGGGFLALADDVVEHLDLEKLARLAQPRRDGVVLVREDRGLEDLARITEGNPERRPDAVGVRDAGVRRTSLGPGVSSYAVPSRRLHWRVGS